MDKQFPLVKMNDDNENYGSMSSKKLFANPIATSNPNNAPEKLHFESNSPYYVDLLPTIKKANSQINFMSAHNFHINPNSMHEQTNLLGRNTALQENQDQLLPEGSNQILINEKDQKTEYLKNPINRDKNDNLHCYSTWDASKMKDSSDTEIFLQKYSMIRKIMHELK